MQLRNTSRVHWVALTSHHQDWNANRCLYAYLAPDGREVIYVGMTWDQTVEVRWHYTAKPEFWNVLQKQLGIRRHIVLAGRIELPKHRRLSRALLMDIESLLIHQLRPCGNVQAIHSRISRPSLVVRCIGVAWPGPRHFFDR